MNPLFAFVQITIEPSHCPTLPSRNIAPDGHMPVIMPANELHDRATPADIDAANTMKIRPFDLTTKTK